MKLYNKPELNVEKFNINDVITDGSVADVDQDLVEDSVMAGIEFDINVGGDEF